MKEATPGFVIVTCEPTDKWFVWTKKGRAPRFAHESEAAAMAEASRLAHVFPGRKFHVMRSICKISVDRVAVPESLPREVPYTDQEEQAQ